VNLQTETRLSDGTPARLERRETFEELHDPIVGFGPQLGSFDFGGFLQPFGEAIGALSETADRLVDEHEGLGFAAPMNAELDGLVGNTAAGDRDRPSELFAGLANEAALAAHHATERELRKEHVVAGFGVVSRVKEAEERTEAVVEGSSEFVAQDGIEAGSFLATRTKLGEHVLLGRVELDGCLHASRLAVPGHPYQL
jgi:hypothetical protein